VDGALTAARILVQILTDHADIRNDEQFQRAIVERWLGEGNALITEELVGYQSANLISRANAAISQLQRRHFGWGVAHRPIRR
jgi:hypothetical protein